MIPGHRNNIDVKRTIFHKLKILKNPEGVKPMKYKKRKWRNNYKISKFQRACKDADIY
jgi:hypothetical protein